MAVAALVQSTEAASPSLTVPDPTARWRALLHRWFVQYNPFYLVSAMLVLAGLNLVSRGFVQQGSQHGALVVAALSELYAFSLLVGTALLVRSGQRRSAVMLAMLVVVYQADLMLHTETCAVLGMVGRLAAAAWLALFVLKLLALGRALGARISSRALATASLGALGLVVFPQVLPLLGPGTRGTLLACFVFALGMLVPRAGQPTLVPHEGLDAWGSLVLRRSVRVGWLVWAFLLGVHLAFWSNQVSIEATPLVAAVAFVATRWSGERTLWAVLVAAVLVAAAATPAHLSGVASFAALTLGLRALAWRERVAPTATAGAPECSPYRGGAPEPGSVDVILPFLPTERLRLLTGALAFAYVGLWTLGWTGGSWPAHRALVDVAFVLTSLLLARRLGGRLVLAFAPAVGAHALAAAGWIPRPQSPLAWGALLLALGFVLLFGSLVVSHRAQRQHLA